ncbi:MAG: hypothetical protein WAX29_06030 [Propionibacterium sp.]
MQHLSRGQRGSNPFKLVNGLDDGGDHDQPGAGAAKVCGDRR